MEKAITNDECGYVMMSRATNIEIAGSIYYYDKYMSGERPDVKMTVVRIPNNFELVKRITGRDDLDVKRDDINNLDNPAYLVYAVNKDINPEDVQILIKSFESEFTEVFERKHKDLCIHELLHIEIDESIKSKSYETIVVFIPEKRGSLNEENHTVVEEG